MNLNQKYCLITGATSGIGLAAAKELAGYGAHLILTTRDWERGQDAKEQILAAHPEVAVDLLECNLSSFDSIYKAAQSYRQSYGELHLLINNAGIWNTEFEETANGIESNFAVNHLSPFLLTLWLADLLKEQPHARIINTSSRAHASATLRFDDLETRNRFKHYQAYGQSKMANILFTQQLDEKLKGTGVTANSFHPGVVRTNLFKDFPFKGAIEAIGGGFMVSPEQGAETLVYLATSPDIEDLSGRYLVKKKVRKPKKEAIDPNNAEILWNKSLEYVKAYLPEPLPL